MMLAPFIEAIYFALNLVWWLIIASVVASWLVAFGVVNTRNDVVYRILDILNRVTEPLLRPIRRLLPPMGGLDLSPMVLLLVIYILQREMIIVLSRGYV
jgi:YggT family protein